jgi:predicted nucleic acid-binding protein
MSYWDTSALLKLYVAEADSSVFRGKSLAEGTPPETAELAMWEARTTFRRKEADGSLANGSAAVLHAQLMADVAAGDVSLILPGSAVEAEFGRVIEACFARTPPLPVRTLDAIHLASAAVSGETEIVATDRRLREAATFLGFSLFPG